MGIHFDTEIRPITKDEYHHLCHEVTGMAFEIHRELGRLYNQKNYQNEIVHRCKARGLEVEAEVPITVTFENFRKTYAMDVLLNRCVDLELKAVEALAAAHLGQALNYLFLAGMTYGKLINMGSPSAEHEFVTTTVTTQDRFNVRYSDGDWEPLDADGEWLRDIVSRMIAEWGSYLDTGLFYRAIHFFRGGRERESYGRWK